MPATETSLLATILANPKDGTARLVYADYLHEQGESRATDEARVRTEGEALLAGADDLPATLTDIATLPRDDRYKASERWASWVATQTLRAIAAECGERAKLTDRHSEHALARDSDVLLTVGGIRVHVEVNHSERSYRYTRPTLNLEVGWTHKKSFPIGKLGFSTLKVVAAALEMLDKRRKNDEYTQRQTENRQTAAVEAKHLRAEFALPDYDVAANLAPASHGPNVTLSLTRTPAEMRRVLTALRAAGLLPTVTAESV